MIVSEAYLRLEVNLSARQKRELGSAILPITEAAGREFFADFAVNRIGEVVVEDGSTKLRARIRASAIMLVSLGGAIGGYGTIRSGLDYMWRDGRTAAGWITAHIKDQLPVAPETARRRAPAATRLRMLFERVERGELSAKEAANRAQVVLEEYHETSDTTRRVIHQLRAEFEAVERRETIPRRRKPTFPVASTPQAIRPGKRLRIFRDPRTNAIVFSES